ncbi:MAG TPA: SDR family oxidoreductase [Phenylobacterium sp.]|nr:SDR family oxidoreductase [Phenylobacterium sp.]
MTLATVIGAGGFIGGRLVAALRAQGREVYAPVRGDPELFARDLGRVFYCAGLTGDFMDRPFDTVEAHVGLIARVLRDARFERLVYLSSTRLYDSLGARGGREDDVLELDPALPRNVYDLSKALGENLCLTRADGRAVVARLSNVFADDAAASGFLSELLQRARREREIVLPSSPDGGRDYIHLDDVLKALLALEAGDAAGIVNVAGGRTLTNAELAQVFADAGWRLTLTGREAPPAPPVCDTQRLRALGITPRDVRRVLADILGAPGFFRG